MQCGLVRRRVRGLVLGAVILASIAVIPAPAIALSCLPMYYAVSYSAPVWAVEVSSASRIPLATVSYWSPWNGSDEPILPHVGHAPSAAERIVYDDADADANVSASDLLLLWDPGPSLGNLSLRYREPPSNYSLRLADVALVPGLRTSCPQAPFFWDGLVTVAIVGTGIVGVLAIAIILARRRR